MTTFPGHVDPDLLRRAMQLGAGIWLQSAWLLLLGIGAGRALRRRGAIASSAIYRGALVAVVVSAVLGVCVAGHIRPLISVDMPSAAQVTTAVPTIIPMPIGANESRFGPPSTVPLNRLPISTPVLVRTQAPASRSSFPLTEVYALVLIAAAAGSTVQLLWLLACHAWLWRLRRSSTAVVDGACFDLLTEQSTRLDVRRPELVVSTRVASPFVAGVFRPCIYLPTQLSAEVDDAEMRAILSHELAHIRQHDCFWNAAFRIACALIWTQPLAWVLRRCWQQASEEVCDQWVLSFDCPPQLYADCLLRLAEGLAGRGRLPERVAGVGVFSFKSLLGRRIQMILTRTHTRLLSLSHSARLTLMLLTASVAVATVFLISTPARSMVREQIHRLAQLPSPATPVVAGKTYVHVPMKLKRSPVLVKTKVNAFLPAMLALASGAVQVNLPADASAADPVITAPAISTTTASTPPLAPPTVAGPSTTVSSMSSGSGAVAPSIPVSAPVVGSTPTADDSITTDGDNCTFDFQYVPVDKALTEFFKVYHVNFEIDQNVHGSVNIQAGGISMLAALRALLHASVPQLTYDYTDGIYRVHIRPADHVVVTPQSQLLSLDQDVASAALAKLSDIQAQANAGTVSNTDVDNARMAYDLAMGQVVKDQAAMAPDDHQLYTLPIQNVVASDLLARLQAPGGLMPAGVNISVNSANNSFVVRGTPEEFDKVKQVVQLTDVAPQHVWVAIKIVRATPDELRKLDVDPAGLQILVPDSDAKKLTAALSDGRLTLDVAPVIETASGVKASLSEHFDGPTGTEVGVSVTPTLLNSGLISLTTVIDDKQPDGFMRSIGMSQEKRTGETSLLGAVGVGGAPKSPDDYRLIFATATQSAP